MNVSPAAQLVIPGEGVLSSSVKDSAFVNVCPAVEQVILDEGVSKDRRQEQSLVVERDAWLDILQQSCRCGPSD